MTKQTISSACSNIIITSHYTYSQIQQTQINGRISFYYYHHDHYYYDNHVGKLRNFPIKEKKVAVYGLFMYKYRKKDRHHYLLIGFVCWNHSGTQIGDLYFA